MRKAPENFRSLSIVAETEGFAYIPQAAASIASQTLRTPSRDVRRDIARTAQKQNARFAAGIFSITGGDRGIRTLDTGLSPYASLAGKCLRPLGQVSTCGQG